MNKLKSEIQNDLYNIAHVICFHLNPLGKCSGISLKDKGKSKENLFLFEGEGIVHGVQKD